MRLKVWLLFFIWVIRILLIKGCISFVPLCVLCWISSSCSRVLCCCFWVLWAPISNSIWPESGLKRSLDREISLLLILFIDVQIRTRRDHFWTSSVLMEIQQHLILELRFEEMERDRCPDRKSSNRFNLHQLIKLM